MAIPGGALLGPGLSVVASEAGLPGAETWGGSLFLGALGIGFAAVYLRDHGRWWAIIPTGVMLTLALPAVGGATEAGARVSGALFFVGLAVTFAPVAVLAVLVALEATALLSVFDYLWPLALIAGGGFLLWRALGRRHTPEPV